LGDELLEVWERTRKTIVFVTHSLMEAIYLSDCVLVLQGRPSTIVDSIDVRLPRPRDLEVMGTAEFGQLRNRIWRHLAHGD
jgi:NitT/TauT family transport system ATP-binding protein